MAGSSLSSREVCGAPCLCDRLARETNVALPVRASPPSIEAIREWFRRLHDREPTEQEVNDIKDKLAGRPPDTPRESH